MTKINREYKDRLFRLLFGSEEMKDNILQLYNALNGSNYDNVDDIEITTLEDVIYIKMKNDVSFLFDSYLSLWEQQSTFNRNMPLRGLMYFGELYSKYCSSNKIKIYGEKLQKIPTPRYVVFYNGDKEREAIEKLRLSDAFINEDKSGDFEWTATMYNLNKGKNEELLQNCKPLRDYMELINRIRNYQKNYPLVQAVDMAVDSCIEDGVLAEFLENHKAEVRNMILTEFDEKSFVEGIREEGEEIGFEKGLEKGIEKGIEKGKNETKLDDIKKLMHNLNLTLEKAMKALDIPESEYEKYKAML